MFQEEAVRVVEAGKQQGVTLRIIGALAFHHHCPRVRLLPGEAEPRVHRHRLRRLRQADQADPRPLRGDRLRRGRGDQRLPRRGRAPHLQQPADAPARRRVHGQARLLPSHPLEGPPRGRRSSRSRWPSSSSRRCRSCKINEKDIIDTIMLLREHEIAASDEDCINSVQVAKLCAARVGPVAHHDDEPRQDARLPAPPRPVGRGQGASSRAASPSCARPWTTTRRAPSGSSAPGSATRSSGTRRSTSPKRLTCGGRRRTAHGPQDR